MPLLLVVVRRAAWHVGNEQGNAWLCVRTVTRWQVSKLNPLKMGACWGDEEFIGRMCKVGNE